MKINERILQYLELKDISKYRFYQITGLSNGFLDKKGNIGSDKCEIICSHFIDLSAEWLLTGNGKMLKENSLLLEPEKKYHAKKSDKGIPLIPITAMAGAFTGDLQILDQECDRYVVPIFKGADFLIPVKGSSMYPKYSSGDIVACKRIPIDTFFQWNKVYVLDTDQGPLIKRVNQGKAENSILIVSDNDKYPPFELNRTQIHNIALVLGVIRLE